MKHPSLISIRQSSPLSNYYRYSFETKHDKSPTLLNLINKPLSQRIHSTVCNLIELTSEESIVLDGVERLYLLLIGQMSLNHKVKIQVTCVNFQCNGRLCFYIVNFDLTEIPAVYYFPLFVYIGLIIFDINQCVGIERHTLLG